LAEPFDSAQGVKGSYAFDKLRQYLFPERSPAPQYCGGVERVSIFYSLSERSESKGLALLPERSDPSGARVAESKGEITAFDKLRQ